MIGFIVSWLIIGLVAGFGANFFLHAGHGILFDLILGLAGAVIGGFIATALFGIQTNSLIAHIVVAFVGAVILIGLVRMVEGRRRGVFG